MTDKRILKIYSEYADKIYAGTKKYELRKDDKNIKKGDKVLLLEITDELIIKGYFVAGETIIDIPENIWTNYHNLLGISKEKYFAYYQGVKTAYCINIESSFENKASLVRFDRSKVAQSLPFIISKLNLDDCYRGVIEDFSKPINLLAEIDWQAEFKNILGGNITGYVTSINSNPELYAD